jgi:hypothetical protein
MAVGSAWPSWATVAGEDAACSVVATSPVPCSDDTNLQPSARLPVPDVVSGVDFDDEEMQLLLDSIAWSVRTDAAFGGVERHAILPESDRVGAQVCEQHRGCMKGSGPREYPMYSR